MKKLLPYILFAFLAALLMKPFFGPGFLFLLDMVWSPNLQLSDHISAGINSNFPLILLIKLFSFVLPLEIIQKLVLGLVFFLAASFMFIFAKENKLETRWAIAAGLLYMINPWTYERFLAGHWLVLLGYAFFPLAVTLFQRALQTPSRSNRVKLILLLAIYPILSLHWAYISYLFLAFGGLIYLWQVQAWQQLKSPAFIKNSLLLVLSIVTVNSFWLFSFWGTTSVWPKISFNDFRTFTTLADPSFGSFFNVLSLYGYWQDIYFLPKDFLSLWWLLSLVIISLSLIGLIRLIREKKPIGYIIALGFLPILFLAVGLANSLSAKIVELLFHTLPGFKGLRETAKLGGVIAFFLAFLYAVGARTLLSFGGRPQTKAAHLFKKTAYVLVLCLPLLSAYGIFSAFNGQLKPYEYPRGWQAVEEKLSQEQGVNKVLFLPWHGYPILNFAGNKKIANPANSYFSVPIIQGKNLDNVYLLETDQGEWDRYITAVVQGLETIDTSGEFLAMQGVSHILLAKIHDYEAYAFLSEAQSLEKEYEDTDIILYRLATQ